MKKLVVLSIDQPIGEDHANMATLLCMTLKKYNPDINIKIGFFTNRIPAKKSLNKLSRYADLIFDKRFEVETDSDNIFIRSFTIQYFTKYNDEYDIIYLDNDVVCLSNIDHLFKKQLPIQVEYIPKYVKRYEEEETGIYVEEDLYYNWFHIYNKYTKELYSKLPEIKNWNDNEKLISKRLKHLPTINQTFGSYYPMSPLNKKHCLFHYDSFDTDGFFYKLKYIREDEYEKLIFIITQILNIEYNYNDDHYNYYKKMEKKYGY